jgi:hypothetical protein
MTNPKIVLRTEAREPFRTAAQDRRRDRDALHVVHRRRAAVQSRPGRERRLQPWLALLALQAFEHRGFLAADVRARAAMREHIERSRDRLLPAFG